MLKQLLQRYQKEIVGFGFVYQPYIHTIVLILMYGGVLAFAYLFQMSFLYLGLSVLSLTFLTPILLYLIYEYGAEEREFAEFTNFILHICSSFNQHPKILNALVECSELTSGNLRKCLDDTIHRLREGDMYDEALQPLMNEYSYYLFANLFQLMISVESFGANTYEAGINLIQEDLDDVIEDMYLYQHNLMGLRSKVFILCGLSIIVSFMCRDMMMELYDFHGEPIYQFMLFVYVLILFISITASQLFLRHTWRIWK